MSIILNESNSSIFVAAGADEVINGLDDVITTGGSVTLDVNGYSNTISASASTLTINNAAAGVGNTVNGSDDNFIVPINSHLTVNGAYETIADAGHGFLTLGDDYGSSVVFGGTVMEITIPSNAVYLQFTGTQNNFYLGDHDSGTISGDDDNFYGSFEHFVLTGSVKGGDEFVGDDDRATISGTNAQLLLYGHHEVIHCGAGTSMAVMSGTDDRFIGAGFYVLTLNAADDPTTLWIGGNGETGAYDSLTGDDWTAVIVGYSDISMSGDDDTVLAHLNSQMFFVGDGLHAHMGQGDSLQITGKGATSALDVLTGAHCSVSVNTAANVELALLDSTAIIGNGVNLTVERSNNQITAYISDTIDILWGDSNQLTIGVNDVITDGGAGTLFKVGNNVGATTIQGFAADTTGVVDLLSGMDGFTTAAQFAAALTSDGAGGLKLGLGIYGSLDFVGDTSLTSANFRVG